MSTIKKLAATQSVVDAMHAHEAQQISDVELVEAIDEVDNSITLERIFEIAYDDEEFRNDVVELVMGKVDLLDRVSADVVKNYKDVIKREITLNERDV